MVYWLSLNMLTMIVNPPPGPHHYTERVSNPGFRHERRAL